MALEKKFRAIPPQPVIVDGDSSGKIQLTDVSLFKVEQEVILKAIGESNLLARILDIPNTTTLVLGLKDAKTRNDIVDLSAYTVSKSTTIESPIQERPPVSLQDVERWTFEETPTVARRVFNVDVFGNPYTTQNPFPVRLSDGSVNIGSVNAELEVQLTHRDDDPNLGDIHDSIRIGDGVEELAINPDQSINVRIVGTGGEVKNFFGEVVSVPSSSAADIVSYTVPVGKVAQLIRTEFSGNNIATYETIIGSDVIDRKRTWFNGNMSERSNFNASSSGQIYSAGTLIKIRVTNFRPTIGDFEGKITVIEV